MKTIFSSILLFLYMQGVAQSPDLILHGGKIFTADMNHTFVTALAIRGEKIVATGTDEKIKALAGPKTKLIDLEGKTVVPGFNDAHTHPGAEYPSRQVELQKLPTDPTPWAKIQDSIKRITKEIPVGTLIRVTIHPDLFEDKQARLKTLDSIAPHHPVILTAWTGHGKILNSQAIRLTGIKPGEPVLGGWEEKDDMGKPNGLFHEYAAYSTSARLSKLIPEKDALANLQLFYQQALSFGITSNQVMATQMPAALFRKIFAVNDFSVRNRLIAFPFTNEKELISGDWTKMFGKIHSRAEVSGVKIILDGTPIERLAATTAAYTDAPSTDGHINFDDAAIKNFIRYCLDQGQQIMVHAVGDRTVKKMIELMRSLHSDNFWKDKRVRIEHGDMAIMDSSDLLTLKKLGIVVVQNPMHFALPQLMGQRLGNRTPYLQAMRSLLRSDIPLAIGSDGPNNPFLNIMMAAIHPDNPSEAISVPEAVRAYTYGSAYAEFKEKEKGTLEAGKLADLVILSQDIFTVPVKALPGTFVQQTMIGGKFVYKK